MRLKGYDYAEAGAYFVTICTKDRACLFGDVQKDNMILNEYGKIVQKLWDDISKKYRRVRTDQFIVMPNHIHGIIEIRDNVCRG
jgi:putative transposase